MVRWRKVRLRKGRQGMGGGGRGSGRKVRRRKVRRQKLNWKLHGAEVVERRKGLNGAADGWTGDWIGQRKLRAER